MFGGGTLLSKYEGTCSGEGMIRVLIMDVVHF